MRDKELIRILREMRAAIGLLVVEAEDMGNRFEPRVIGGEQSPFAAELREKLKKIDDQLEMFG